MEHYSGREITFVLYHADSNRFFPIFFFCKHEDILVFAWPHPPPLIVNLRRLSLWLGYAKFHFAE